MKKYHQKINLFDPQTGPRRNRVDKIKTTNVNILLNRVTLAKKDELIKKMIYLFLLFSISSLVGFFSLI